MLTSSPKWPSDIGYKLPYYFHFLVLIWTSSMQALSRGHLSRSGPVFTAAWQSWELWHHIQAGCLWVVQGRTVSWLSGMKYSWLQAWILLALENHLLKSTPVVLPLCIILLLAFRLPLRGSSQRSSMARHWSSLSCLGYAHVLFTTLQLSVCVIEMFSEYGD